MKISMFRIKMSFNTLINSGGLFNTFDWFDSKWDFTEREK